MINNHRNSSKFDSTDINKSQSQLLFEQYQRKKKVWIIASTIISILIIIIITIPTIIIMIKRTDPINTATTQIILTSISTESLSIQTLMTTTTTTTTTTITRTTTERFIHNNINISTKWRPNAVTVAGGNGQGSELNQLNFPLGIFVDDDEQVIYITERDNARVVGWKYNAQSGEIVAGGNGAGPEINQLNYPSDVIVDRKDKSLIICDQLNKRVIRWSRRNHTRQTVVIYDISCYSLAMDDDGNLYVANHVNHEVRRWGKGDRKGIVVAGGNGKGNQLDQLFYPTYIFVDHDQTVYVSEYYNYRVMKWMKNATKGIIVAGGNGDGNTLAHITIPQGVIVDHLNNVYVTNMRTEGIMRWLAEAKQGTIVVGGNNAGEQANQLYFPAGISFDRVGNLYVVDMYNHRVQKFAIDLN